MSTPTRIRRGTTQSRVDHYQHPETGKRVTLVGMVHIGVAEYYANVERLVERLQSEGAVVHYESSRFPSDDEPISAEEGDLLARLRESSSIRVVAEWLGLKTQHAITIQPDWVNTDMTLLDVIREHRYPDSMASGPEGVQRVLENPQTRAFAAPIALFIYRRIGLLVMTVKPFACLTKRGREDRRVILDMRNRIAVAAADGADGDVVALWGGAHLDGIGAGLQRLGYRFAGRTWLDVLPKDHRLPEYAS